MPASTAGGIINIVVSNLVLGVDKTNWPVMLVLGVVNAALYFFLFTFLIKKLNLHTPGREEESELAESVAEGEAAASVAVKQGAVAAAPQRASMQVLPTCRRSWRQGQHRGARELLYASPRER
ncbi:MAG: hypothetical protein ACLU37_00845 [Collinsella sp.]